MTRRHPAQIVQIVDGTLVPAQDRSIAAPSKNYRHSMNLQVGVHADTCLVVAVGDPQPGNRNDCIASADSGVDQAIMGAYMISTPTQAVNKVAPDSSAHPRP